jgi:MFS transporter, NNP family, nitrate/nitrite transporter
LNRHTLIAFGASLGMGVAFLNLTPVLPLLQISYGVSNAQMALLVTALILTHSLVQVPSGLVVDKIGVKTGVSLALGLGFLGSLFSIFSSNFGFLLAMRLLTGIGTGLSFVAGLHYGTAHAREEKKIQVQAIFGGLINVGSMIPFFTSSVLLKYDGRLIHLFTSLFFFLPLIAVLIWGKDPQKTEKISRTHVAQVFRAKTTWTLGFCYAVFFGGMMTIGIWIPSYLMRSQVGFHDFSRMGLIGGLVIGISAAGRFLGALMPSRIRPQALITWALLFLVLSYSGLGVSQELIPGLILLGIAALMNSVTFGSVFNLAYRHAPPQGAGTVVGTVNFIACVGAFFFPVIFGYFFDLTGTFKVSFLFLTALALLAIFPVFTLSAKTKEPVNP